MLPDQSFPEQPNSSIEHPSFNLFRQALELVGDNNNLNIFFSTLDDEKLKSLMKELDSKTNVKPKDQDLVPNENEVNDDISFQNGNQKVNLEEIGTDIVKQMFQNYASHTVIQALDNQEKWNDLFSHLNDNTLHIPNYTCKKYEAALKGNHLLTEDSQ